MAGSAGLGRFAVGITRLGVGSRSTNGVSKLGLSSGRTGGVCRVRMAWGSIRAVLIIPLCCRNFLRVMDTARFLARI